MPMTYGRAVSVLDKGLQKKSVHNVQDLLHAMQSICNEATWASKEDQTDFANICSNFDKYVHNNGLKSIGRKQFEKWWELMDDMGQLPEDPLPDSFEDAIDQITEAFTGVDTSKEAFDQGKEIIRLRNKIKELEAELRAANQKLDNIKGIILWG